MSFQVGDCVVLPAHGVGRIVRLEERHFTGKEPGWYYEVVTARSTVWVTVEAHEAAGLRHLTSRDDLGQCRDALRSQPALLNKDHQQRRLELAGRLRQPSLLAMCEVVRDLSALGWRRPLAEADSSSLRRARENLYEEWAAAAEVSLAEATQEIEALLQEARGLYQA